MAGEPLFYVTFQLLLSKSGIRRFLQLSNEFINSDIIIYKLREELSFGDFEFFIDINLISGCTAELIPRNSISVFRRKRLA